MITIKDVLVACETLNRISSYAAVNSMFIFESQSPKMNEPFVPSVHLFVGVSNTAPATIQEIHNQADQVLNSSTNKIYLTIGFFGESIICPICREHFSTHRFAVHIKKHGIRKLDISNELASKGETYIQNRINILLKPALLPKFKKEKKKKKRKKKMIFSGGAPGLGKKN